VKCKCRQTMHPPSLAPTREQLNGSVMDPASTTATILVVEDDPVLCEVLCRILSRDGHQVSRALSATQALGVIEQHCPEIVLLDVCLKEGTGLRLAENIHARKAEVPIILLTTAPIRGDDLPHWAAGRLLYKSLDLPDLRRAITAAAHERFRTSTRSTA
jgi:CheY-like chemotaxis protein